MKSSDIAEKASGYHKNLALEYRLLSDGLGKNASVFSKLKPERLSDVFLQSIVNTVAGSDLTFPTKTLVREALSVLPINKDSLGLMEDTLEQIFSADVADSRNHRIRKISIV